MKMKQLNDRTIKISISMKDLEERGMELADFLMPQEKTEDFFYTILDELELSQHFLDSGMLSFRVTPKPDRLDVFVTKSDVDKAMDFDEIDFEDLPRMEDFPDMEPEEFIKAMEEALKEYSQDPQSDELLSELDNFRQQVQADQEEELDASETQGIRGSKSDNHFLYYVLQFSDFNKVREYADLVDYDYDGSELYKYKGRYYLTVLVNTSQMPGKAPVYLMARMREMAEESQVTRPVLQEHGTVLLYGTAIEDLQRI
ncbi:adaptor protein MecA [Streptococcus danieliae]|uniref:Adapter protein MecA n=1 Tax=Streptococcus danieliae TaxID=747656 RepID=A0A7Z0M7U8_9STRE|nr:adaptor protein MecA [Streptococcus danieliae]MBF0700155.1 adaptor protein MecA [Streptococcus danieliae]NYS97331.1 adaptor protein MecA [Streptococcus danieliae]